MIDRYSFTTKILVQGKLKKQGLVKVFWILFVFILLLILFKLLMEDIEGVIKSLRGIIVPCVLISIAYRNLKREKYVPYNMDIEFYDNFMKMIIPSIDTKSGRGLHCEVVEINYTDIEQMEYNIPLFCLHIYGPMRKIEYAKPNNFDEIISEVKISTYDIYMEAKDREVLLDKMKKYSGKEIN